jgi:hypothetical protein
MKNIIKLESEFTGIGEVSGVQFSKVYEDENGYVYKRYDGDFSIPSFEAFYKKTAPICIDFKKRIYSETDFKEVYPKSNSFGVWAWSVSGLQRGIEKLTT